MSIDTWRNLVLPRVPGATEALVDEEIKKAIENFCRESTAWRDTLYGYNVVALNREIPLVVGAGDEATVVGILRVYFDQKQITAYSHAEPKSAGLWQVMRSLTATWNLAGTRETTASPQLQQFLTWINR